MCNQLGKLSLVWGSIPGNLKLEMIALFNTEYGIISNRTVVHISIDTGVVDMQETRLRTGV